MRISDWSSDVCSSDLPPVLVEIEPVDTNQRALRKLVLLTAGLPRMIGDPVFAGVIEIIHHVGNVPNKGLIDAGDHHWRNPILRPSCPSERITSSSPIRSSSRTSEAVMHRANGRP